jgi:hypothetical protein
MPINTIQERIVPKLVPITPYEIFLQQVKGTYDAIRSDRDGFTYTPPQMGGIFGQKDVIDECIVLELTDFEVT